MLNQPGPADLNLKMHEVPADFTNNTFGALIDEAPQRKTGLDST